MSGNATLPLRFCPTYYCGYVDATPPQSRRNGGVYVMIHIQPQAQGNRLSELSLCRSDDSPKRSLIAAICWSCSSITWSISS